MKSFIFICLFVICLYFVSHLLNFSNAPWNQNGLFDDAAWDIYFAKNHIFNGTPFQAAFFDSVGYISREVVFHYYISVFFRLFGYNLLVFNISLLVLGFITIFFTTLLIHKIFKNIIIILLSALILNFFPLHFMHIFMGHRYAIAAPLMMVSLYYLYTSFTNKSYLRASISALFAALCFSSAVMGKQYLYGLILSAVCVLLFDKSKVKSKVNLYVTGVWLISFLISSLPMILYIINNSSVYAIREQSLLNDFLVQIKNGGIVGLQPFIDQIKEIFFVQHSYRRQFLVDFPVIPFAYYALILPGLYLAWVKKYYIVVWLAIIPIVASFISGSYDFRVLLATTFWVISMAFTMQYILKNRRLVFGICFIILGFVPSIIYIWNMSKNPNSQYLLPHKDVAVSRLVQDIVSGAQNPTSKMKRDELNPKVDLSSIPYDTFVCPASAYAIAHVYLQNYDDKKILSFCDGGIQQLMTSSEILNFNINAIMKYNPIGKDLKLIWEMSDKINDIIPIFRKYLQYGHEQTFSDIVDGTPFSLYVLTIKNEYIRSFQDQVLKDFRYSQL